MSLNVQFSSAKMNSLAFVKRGTVIEAEKPIAAQIRMMTLSDGSPYETLHSYVSVAVAPFFKVFHFILVV